MIINKILAVFLLASPALVAFSQDALLLNPAFSDAMAPNGAESAFGLRAAITFVFAK